MKMSMVSTFSDSCCLCTRWNPL